MENSCGSDFINQQAMIQTEGTGDWADTAEEVPRHGKAFECSLKSALLNQGFKAVVHRMPSGTSAWDAHTSAA